MKVFEMVSRRMVFISHKSVPDIVAAGLERLRVSAESEECQGRAAHSVGCKWHAWCSILAVRKILRLVFITSCLFVASAQLGRAETASYPEKNPLFTVEIPVGWQVQRENGAVKLIAPDNAVCLLQYVESVKDEGAAQAALPQLTEFEAHQFSLENLVISGTPKAAKLGDFRGFTCDGRGTDKAGKETFLETMLFAPKEGAYYIITCLWFKDGGAEKRPLIARRSSTP